MTTMNGLIEFLILAKKNTYAAEAAEAEPSRPCSHDLRFSGDEYAYIDTYLGSESFVGEEAVWRHGKPVWAMNYAGRILGGGFSGGFLKAALMRVPRERPFRGPHEYSDGGHRYQCDVDGDFEWFHGDETIFKDGVKIYECRFHGGTVK